ncbi:hypothetical protein ABT56_20015 [Photobacterium aquae]|uniref:Uncharacterized protein n=1 Tax=Photobacterium aquae TaxID=1195763 RepID=A0A0J1GUR0_9GAMM|nr:hypothetical protein [Photobacterium aquae]KLV03406.1 hypothetical protein ABT56_20015 [Photobacterium aquae]
MNLLKQMEVIVSAVPAPYMEHQPETLSNVDREIIEKLSNAGEQYLWVIKSSGYGTQLMEIGLPAVCERVEEEDPQSLFYHLRLSDVNQGTIVKIAKSKAMELANSAACLSITPNSVDNQPA